MLHLCENCGYRHTHAERCPYCGMATPPYLRSLPARALAPVKMPIVRLLFFVLIVAQMAMMTHDPSYWSSRWKEWRKKEVPLSTAAQVRWAPQVLNVRVEASESAKVRFQLKPGDPVWIGPPSAGGWAPVYEPEQGVPLSAMVPIGQVQARLLSASPSFSSMPLDGVRQAFDIATGYVSTEAVKEIKTDCSASNADPTVFSCRNEYPARTASECRSVAVTGAVVSASSGALELREQGTGKGIRTRELGYACGDHWVRVRIDRKGTAQVEQSHLGRPTYRKTLTIKTLARKPTV
jgi:hypothetical protein